jgi:hypothetical protein
MTAETLLATGRAILRIAFVLGLALIMIHGFYLFVKSQNINESLEALANSASTHTSTLRYYRFPDGMTPVIHTYEYDFWLCQNESGEYLQCQPTIEVKEAG